MSLLKGVLSSDLEMVKNSIGQGDEINYIFDMKPPLSLLEIAIQISSEKNSDSAKDIVSYLKLHGALTYDEYMKRPAVINTPLPPLYKKSLMKRNVRSGIALASRGGYSKRNRKLRRTRKIRRS